MILKSIQGAWDAVRAFFRGYDQETGMSPGGYPVLQGWPEGLSPYEYFLSGIKGSGEGPNRCGLIFMRGRRKGEVICLRDGMFSIGTACTNDVVIESDQLTERKLTLKVEEDAVTVATDNLDSPVLINGHSSQNSVLVDQDECQFNDSAFYYMEIRTEGKKS